MRLASMSAWRSRPSRAQHAGASTADGAMARCSRTAAIASPAAPRRCTARGRRSRASMPAGSQRQQRLDVGERADAARGGHRNADRLGERARRGDVDALLRAVAADVGVDDAAGAELLRPAAPGRPRVVVAGLGPALAPRPCRRARRCRRRCGRESAGRPRATTSGCASAAVPKMTRSAPSVEQLRRRARRVRTPPPTSIGIGSAAHSAAIAAPFTGAPLTAPSRSTTCRYCAPSLDPAPPHGHRIVAVDGLGAHLAAQQAHALAALQIDGRERSAWHRRLPAAAFARRPRARRSSPGSSARRAWLFSGWNCGRRRCRARSPRRTRRRSRCWSRSATDRAGTT